MLTTVHAANADHGREVYRFLRDELGAQFVQFIPIIERNRRRRRGRRGAVVLRGATGRSTCRRATVTGALDPAEQYGRFLIDVFEEWVRRDVGEVYVQMFDVALANWVGEPPGLCIHSETCGRALALEHTGDLYSCDHFVEPRYKLGNIAEHAHARPRRLRAAAQFGLDKRDTLPRYCRECDVRFACHGGCPKDRFIADARRRARAQLPLRRLQGLLPPRRPADAVHGASCPPATARPRRIRPLFPPRGQGARPQRSLSLRRRPQVEVLPRGSGSVNVVWGALVTVALAGGRSRRCCSSGAGRPRAATSRTGTSAAGVFGVLATGFSVLLGFIVFLAFTSYDQSRSGAETEAQVVVQQIETAQFFPESLVRRADG